MIDSIKLGPAWISPLIAMPESENIPVPIIAPTPKTMRSNALRVFFSPDFF